jgi:hypothetical protein
VLGASQGLLRIGIGSELIHQSIAVFLVLLMMAGVGYLAGSFATLVLPRYAPLVSQVVQPVQFMELPIILWLSIWGAKTSPPDVSTASKVQVPGS